MGVHAWWDQGHLIVSRIAYDILKQDSPDTISKVEKVLGYYKNMSVEDADFHEIKTWE